MVIHKNTLIFKRQQNTGWKFDWLSVLNNACTKTKVIKYRKYLPKTKKVLISVKPFCVSDTLQVSFYWLLFPEKAIAAMRVFEMNSCRNGVVWNIE